MKKKRERKRRNGKKLASIHVLHLSIYFCFEGEQRIDVRETEREKQRENDSTTSQPTPRAHHHIIQFASVLTRSSNSGSYSRGNEDE
jgi:hypothetical protein